MTTWSNQGVYTRARACVHAELTSMSLCGVRLYKLEEAHSGLSTMYINDMPGSGGNGYFVAIMLSEWSNFLVEF